MVKKGGEILYIFPKNYNFKNKILGVLDYPTAIFNLVILFLLYKFIFIFKIKPISKLVLIIIFYMPVLLITINHNEENVLFSIYYVIKFLFSTKLYIYK